nr:unnamed protein product [Digitaria exilis]
MCRSQTARMLLPRRRARVARPRRRHCPDEEEDRGTARQVQHHDAARKHADLAQLLNRGHCDVVRVTDTLLE